MSHVIDDPAPTLDLAAPTDDVAPPGEPTIPDLLADPTPEVVTVDGDAAEDAEGDEGDVMGAWVRFKAPTREQIANAVDEVDTVTLPAVSAPGSRGEDP